MIKVEDKPGAIGEVTSILAGRHINIKEIEILKQREGETDLSGWACHCRKALEAYSLLKELGYTLETRW